MLEWRGDRRPWATKEVSIIVSSSFSTGNVSYNYFTDGLYSLSLNFYFVKSGFSKSIIFNSFRDSFNLHFGLAGYFRSCIICTSHCIKRSMQHRNGVEVKDMVHQRVDHHVSSSSIKGN